MKKIFFLVLLGFFFLNPSNVIAQYGYGNNGYGSNGMSGMRGQGMQNNFPQQSQNREQTEKEKEENLNKAVDKLKTDLSLDELQVFAIKKELSDSSKTMETIVKSDKSDEEKTNEIQAISEKTDRNINGYLNKEQKEKYKKFIAEKKERLEKMKDKRLR